MSDTDIGIERRLRALVGPDTSIEIGNDGTPKVAPPSTTACALVLQTAAAEGWTVRLAGHESWVPLDAPAQLTLSSSALSQVEEVRAVDFVATVQSGVDHKTLRAVLADHGAWWPVDAPEILIERLAYGMLAETDDAQEAAKAFLEKRPPRFKGR